MSSEVSKKPETSQEVDNNLPRPKHIILTPVEDGAFARALPTITAVYLGKDEVPSEDVLLRIDGGCLELSEISEDRLELYLFLIPLEGEALDDMPSFAYELASTTPIIDRFWDNVDKIKAFVFQVSTDNYFFSCRVNTKTATATEIKLDLRYLH